MLCRVVFVSEVLGVPVRGMSVFQVQQLIRTHTPKHGYVNLTIVGPPRVTMLPHHDHDHHQDHDHDHDDDDDALSKIDRILNGTSKAIVNPGSLDSFTSALNTIQLLLRGEIFDGCEEAIKKRQDVIFGLLRVVASNPSLHLPEARAARAPIQKCMDLASEAADAGRSEHRKRRKNQQQQQRQQNHQDQLKINNMNEDKNNKKHSNNIDDDQGDNFGFFDEEDDDDHHHRHHRNNNKEKKNKNKKQQQQQQQDAIPHSRGGVEGSDLLGLWGGCELEHKAIKAWHLRWNKMAQLTTDDSFVSSHHHTITPSHHHTHTYTYTHKRYTTHKHANILHTPHARTHTPHTHTDTDTHTRRERGGERYRKRKREHAKHH